MQSVLLDTPEGISARLRWDPKMAEHDRKRVLAKELVAAKLGVDERDVRVEREAPGKFGFHTQLIAEVDGQPIPHAIRNASFRGATVVALLEPGVPVGLDLRDAHPDDGELHTMQRHSHLLEETDLSKL